MRICVSGAGGFIGHHLVNRLKVEGHYVRGVDIKSPEFSETTADEFLIADLRNPDNAYQACSNMDLVYHLAADMGGIGWIGTHHAEILHSNLLIDANMVHAATKERVGKFHYASSACVYPEYNQEIPDAAPLKEHEVYPALPEAAYGWEKLTGEKLCEHYAKDFGLNVRITRFHNVYGIEETWDGGREKAPAALSRKIALAKLNGEKSIEMWGDGEQRRSFIHVSDVVSGLIALMEADYNAAVNIGNDYTVSINELAKILMDVADYQCEIVHTDGIQGVRGRNSDNTLARMIMPNWKPLVSLEDGMKELYPWVEQQVIAKYSLATK